MKKGIMIAMTAVCLMFTACTGGKTGQKDTTQTPTEVTTETTQGSTEESAAPDTQDPTSDTSSEASTEPAGTAEPDENNAEVNKLTGTVKDAAMHSLVITGEDGKDYNISKDIDRQPTYENYPEGSGLLLGDKVEVSYTGTLDADAQAVSVKLIEAAHTEPAASGEKIEETGTDQPETSLVPGETK